MSNLSGSSLISLMATRASLAGFESRGSNRASRGIIAFQAHSAGCNGSFHLFHDEQEYARIYADAHDHKNLYYFDRRLDTTLSRFAPLWSVQDLPRLYYENEEGMIAFDDSWTAYSWSRWWTSRHKVNKSLDLIVLHVDDHKDLTSPFLLTQAESMLDMFTGQPVWFDDPSTVANAVLSGCIGIGCFILPWIHTLRRMEIRHLRAGTTSSERKYITPVLSRAGRLALQERFGIDEDEQASSVYIGTDDINEWLAEIPENCVVLLHIDLDYFNNKYAGGRKPSHPEPTFRAILERIQAIAAALLSSGIASRVEQTTIALSPGFCPSELWEPMLHYLRSSLKHVKCSCP